MMYNLFKSWTCETCTRQIGSTCRFWQKVFGRDEKMSFTESSNQKVCCTWKRKGYEEIRLVNWISWEAILSDEYAKLNIEDHILSVGECAVTVFQKTLFQLGRVRLLRQGLCDLAWPWPVQMRAMFFVCFEYQWGWNILFVYLFSVIYLLWSHCTIRSLDELKYFWSYL